MERYQKIIEHKEFLEYIKKIEKIEKDRIYCRHNITHLLDVARIAYIKGLEEKLPLSKDVIYGAALLHDIGKIKQYEEKIPHETAGAALAKEVLTDCGYEKEEIFEMEKAILHHRRGDRGTKSDLSRLLYEADKTSRLCMFCQAEKSCHWSEEEKNSRLHY